ncbi:GAF domain-containing protein [Acaryochloris sp. CCMEE 5410]|uniref:GAF domain-containing protein n=1 Tax=Acaryochloris sp. CCMEE 5410 TaxID=310037 RepID=UPI00030C6E02|nr:GAF domain-containing protein [Acaryochloris sp. CCMEE 5410]KAI9129416.1 GAF domain-containing protein [Acaryochloris sp. CCMEE 5410]
MSSSSSPPPNSDQLDPASKMPDTLVRINGKKQEQNLRQRRRAFSIKAKLIGWGLALSMLPVLSVGTITYLTSETFKEQLNTTQPNNSNQLADIQSTLKQRTPLLLIGTGVIALLSGSLVIWLINRELRPLLRAARHSNQLVNRLYRLESNSEEEYEAQDQLLSLANNINLIDEQIPSILHSQEHEAARAELLMQFIGQLHVSLSEEDLLKTTVEEVRQILQTDRVTIFTLNPDGDGTFTAESVAPGYPKLQWSTLHDPCFSEGFQEQYRQGRVRAIHDIYHAGLNDCHIGLLERFAVKANIVAPILHSEKLYGLLIAHQCARPREWNPSEIDLFRQLALQVGYALDRSRVMSQLDSQVKHLHLLMKFTQLIRGSLQTEEILTNTVQESRKVLRADRVIVYSFDETWQGTVAAEAVQPGIPKMIWAKISDPCFADKFVEQYRRGRVQAISNVYEAGLTECHLQQLEKYGVRSNLVVPILVGETLFGLLIAHQCSGSRTWQASEVDLFTQIGIQMGHALKQANLLAQSEQDWIANTTQTHMGQQQLTTLQNQLLAYLQANQPSIQFLVEGVDQHTATAQSAYTHLQTTIEFAQQINTITWQFQSHSHQIVAQVESVQEYLNRHIKARSSITQLQDLEKPIQQLSQIRILVSQLSSQMQLQAMNIAAKVTQDSVPHPELSSAVQKIINVAQKLEDNLTGMKPLIESLQQDLQQNTAILDPLILEMANTSTAQFRPEQLSSNLNAEITQINADIAKLTQIVSNHLQTSSTVSQQVFELNQFLQLLAPQAQLMQASIQKMETEMATE